MVTTRLIGKANPPAPPFLKGGTAKANAVARKVTTMAGNSRLEHPSEHLHTRSKKPIGFPPLKKGGQGGFALAVASNATATHRQRQPGTPQ
jgi:hypothetical protein